MSEKKDYEVIMVKESLIQSVLSDCFSIGIFIGALFVNYNFLGNSVLVKIVIISGLLMMGYSRGSKKIKYLTPEQAYEILKDRFESEVIE